MPTCQQIITKPATIVLDTQTLKKIKQYKGSGNDRREAGLGMRAKERLAGGLISEPKPEMRGSCPCGGSGSRELWAEKRQRPAGNHMRLWKTRSVIFLQHSSS